MAKKRKEKRPSTITLHSMGFVCFKEDSGCTYLLSRMASALPSELQLYSKHRMMYTDGHGHHYQSYALNATQIPPIENPGYAPVYGIYIYIYMNQTAAYCIYILMLKMYTLKNYSNKHKLSQC